MTQLNCHAVDRVKARPPRDPDYLVHTARTPHATYLDAAQKRWPHRVGFVTKPIIRDKIELARYLLISLRGQPAGYLYWSGGFRKPIRMIQHAISEELWLHGYGTLIVAAMADIALTAPYAGVYFSLREDIPTHGFWRLLGARPLRLRFGGRDRKKMIVDYIIDPNHVSTLAHTLRESDGTPDQRFRHLNPLTQRN